MMDKGLKESMDPVGNRILETRETKRRLQENSIQTARITVHAEASDLPVGLG